MSAPAPVISLQRTTPAAVSSAGGRRTGEFQTETRPNLAVQAMGHKPPFAFSCDDFVSTQQKRGWDCDEVAGARRSYPVLVAKSLASWRSCNCSSGGPLVRLTIRPRLTAA